MLFSTAKEKGKATRVIIYMCVDVFICTVYECVRVCICVNVCVREYIWDAWASVCDVECVMCV